MEHWTEYTRFLTALVVILDPFLAVPIFLGLTAGYDQVQRARVALIVSLTVAIVLVAAALSGELVLSLLGTSLSSFRVGGGLVLLLMALAMLRAEADSMRSNPQETTADPSHQGVGVVPLAIPLLAGPGAISTVIIQMDRSTAPYHGLTVIACILGVCVALWLVLRLAAPIGRFLSPTALNVINRLFGLILAAIAVEIMANGLKQLFPALAG
jgi:multiple antibiotic resistance protein